MNVTETKSPKFLVRLESDFGTKEVRIHAPNEERAYEWGVRQGKQFGWSDCSIKTTPIA